jgi:hypothetical protein
VLPPSRRRAACAHHTPARCHAALGSPTSCIARARRAFVLTNRSEPRGSSPRRIASIVRGSLDLPAVVFERAGKRQAFGIATVQFNNDELVGGGSLFQSSGLAGQLVDQASDGNRAELPLFKANLNIADRPCSSNTSKASNDPQPHRSVTARADNIYTITAPSSTLLRVAATLRFTRGERDRRRRGTRTNEGGSATLRRKSFSVPGRSRGASQLPHDNSLDPLTRRT